MKIKKTRIRPVFVPIVLGVLLIAAGLTIFIVSKISGRQSLADNREVCDFIENILPPRTPGIKEERSNPEMPVVSYEGQDYAAILEIIKHGVKLPVSAYWNKRSVNHVPCRFTGNPYDGTLIIGGVDQTGQFDFISDVDIGDKIVLTDMRAQEFTYTVATVRHAKNAKAETLIDPDYDLTLFAKDAKTGDWLLVRCKIN